MSSESIPSVIATLASSDDLQLPVSQATAVHSSVRDTEIVETLDYRKEKFDNRDKNWTVNKANCIVNYSIQDSLKPPFCSMSTSAVTLATDSNLVCNIDLENTTSSVLPDSLKSVARNYTVYTGQLTP